MKPRTWLPVLVLFLVACSQPLTVEQRVIAQIRQMEEKIEAGERRAFMAHIAEDFVGRNGGMNRDQVRALVVFQLRRFERLQAQLFPINVTETGPDTATAEFRALVTGGPGWIPERGQVYDFSTAWQERDGEWLLIGADWAPVPLDEVLDKLPAPSID
ncbi:MAG: nuclear transport factor 2 family protein [Xanthomonadales bacterium]